MSSSDVEPNPATAIARAVTIYDVAREAGVAPSTVSRAFSRPGRVNAETGERVRAIATAMGYRTKEQARVRTNVRTRMLAMIMADVANPVFYDSVRGARSVSEEAGYTLLLAESAESAVRERDTLERAMGAVDGLILTASRISDSAVRQVAKVKPVVVVNRVVPGVPSVVIDVSRGTYHAVEHLVGLGHTKVTYLCGPEASWADGMRWRGLRKGGEDLHVSIRRVGPYAPTIKGGVQAAMEWMKHPCTAVVAYNDMVATGFMRTLAGHGYSIPQDVSVVGFDNSSVAELTSPTLTTVAAPLHTLGKTAATNVLAMIGGARSRRVEPMQLPTRLVVRDSTAAPAARG